MRSILATVASLAILTASTTAAASDGPAASTSGGPQASTVAGITMVSAGAVAAAGGAVAYTWLGLQTPSCDAGCADPYRLEKGASVVGILLGTASIAVGIPLVVLGADDVPSEQRPRNAPLAPELRVGPTGASLSFAF